MATGEDLFDMDEEDIDIVPVRRRAAGHSAEQHSSEEACPPSSESDITGLNTSFENEEDNALNHARAPKTQRKVCLANVSIIHD